MQGVKNAEILTLVTPKLSKTPDNHCCEQLN